MTDGTKKTCGKCAKTLCLSAFPSWVSRKTGKIQSASWCRECKRAFKNQWQKNNREKCNVYRKRSYVKEKADPIKSVVRNEARKAKAERKHKRKQDEAKKKMTRVLIRTLRAALKQKFETSGQFICPRCKRVLPVDRRSKHRDIICKDCKTKDALNWRKNNPDKNKAARQRREKRVRSNPVKYLIKRMRSLTSKHAKRAGCLADVKGKKLSYLGCSAVELASYLQSQWKRGMNWANYGRKPGVKCWEIDHVKAVTLFDLTYHAERVRAFHYTNLQPMWAIDNVKKGNKEIRTQHQPALLIPIPPLGSCSEGDGAKPRRAKCRDNTDSQQCERTTP